LRRLCTHVGGRNLKQPVRLFGFRAKLEVTAIDARPNVFNILQILSTTYRLFQQLTGIFALEAILAPISVRMTSGPSPVIRRSLRGTLGPERGILRRVLCNIGPGVAGTSSLFSTTYKCRAENKQLTATPVFPDAAVRRLTGRYLRTHEETGEENRLPW
jgi:hypothetical protein